LVNAWLGENIVACVHNVRSETPFQVMNLTSACDVDGSVMSYLKDVVLFISEQGEVS
jgi:hypothetical protein